MALRKQVDVPKMPKTRKKTLEKIKNATPTEKKDQVEYSVGVYYSYDKMLKKQFYVVSLRTIKEFSSLSYEISVDVKKSKDSIDVSILGLNTRQTYYIQPSSARTDLMFEDLFGKITVNIIKQDGSINTGVFDFNIYKKDIKLLETYLPEKKNNRLFCTFGVELESSSFE